MQRHRGLTRVVFLIGRWAVKVPSLRSNGDGITGVLWSFTRGLQANLSERNWSTDAGVCPVRWSLAGFVNVYPRCEPVADDYDVDWDAIGFSCPSDRKNTNAGWLNGQIVYVDYDNSWNDCPHGVSVELGRE